MKVFKKHSPKAEITRRLYDRISMNVRTSKVHPDPAARERADARVDAYVIAIEIVSEELS